MKKNLKHYQVVEIVNSIESINKSGEKLGHQFNYALQKNLSLLRGEYQAITDTSRKMSKAINGDLDDLRREHADIDDKGMPIAVDGRYQIKTRESAFKEAFRLFEKRLEEKNIEAAEFDNAETELDVWDIPYSLAEKEKLTGEQMRGLIHVLTGEPMTAAQDAK